MNGRYQSAIELAAEKLEILQILYCSSRSRAFETVCCDNAQRGNYSIARSLIEQGTCSPNAISSENKTLLQLTLAGPVSGKETFLTYLINHPDIDVNKNVRYSPSYVV